GRVSLLHRCGRGSGEYIPLGTYSLSDAEVEAFRQHARAFADNQPHDAVTIGCHRLSSASIRTDPRDRIIDCAVGLESILLAQVGSDLIRGEMRFRFALHYAFLQNDKSTRRAAYKDARMLYDLRSAIAHGGSVPDIVTFSDGPRNVHAAAEKAADMLRVVIKHLLEADSFGPAKPGFWESRFFDED